MRKIKLITSLTSLGVIAAATPIVATSCSGDTTGNYEITPTKDTGNCVIKNCLVTVTDASKKATLDLGYKHSTVDEFIVTGLSSKVYITNGNVLNILPNTATKSGVMINIRAMGKTDNVTLVLLSAKDPVSINTSLKLATTTRTIDIKEYSVLNKYKLAKDDLLTFKINNLPSGKSLADYNFDIEYGLISPTIIPSYEICFHVDEEESIVTWELSYTQAGDINALDSVRFFLYDNDADTEDPFVSFVFYNRGVEYTIANPKIGPEYINSTFENYLWSVSSDSMQTLGQDATLTFEKPENANINPQYAIWFKADNAEEWTTELPECLQMLVSDNKCSLYLNKDQEAFHDGILAFVYTDDNGIGATFFTIEIY